MIAQDQDQAKSRKPPKHKKVQNNQDNQDNQDTQDTQDQAQTKNQKPTKNKKAQVQDHDQAQAQDQNTQDNQDQAQTKNRKPTKNKKVQDQAQDQAQAQDQDNQDNQDKDKDKVKKPRAKKMKTKDDQPIVVVPVANVEQQQQQQDSQDQQQVQDENHGVVLSDPVLADPVLSDKPVSKKRGRKPKGGKIVQQPYSTLSSSSTLLVMEPGLMGSLGTMGSLGHAMVDKPNIILHLKCSLKDLQGLPEQDIVDGFASYRLDYQPEVIRGASHAVHDEDDEAEDEDDDDDDTMYARGGSKEICKKLKVLESNLHNNVCTNRSACFWDTCDFHNPPIHIPKQYTNGVYQVYGCFCSPECAVAYLMEENIDSSTKFERYYMFNHIYAKIYQYTKNIKPAPNPHYMLDKFCGNLTIQEYRSLLQNERLFLIVDKPLTKILPELHEDNEDFILNNKLIPMNGHHLKSKMQPSKSKLVNEKFGLGGNNNNNNSSTSTYKR